MSQVDNLRKVKNETQVQQLQDTWEFGSQKIGKQDFSKKFSTKITMHPKQEFVYFAKHSPCCRFVLFLSIALLVIAILCTSLTTTSVYVCGASPKNHTVSVQGSRDLINDVGMFQDVYQQIGSITDEIYEYDFDKFPINQSILQKFSQIPFSFILNGTKLTSQMESIIIQSGTDQNKVNFQFNQNDRRRSFVQPSFYNAGYWYQVVITRDYQSVASDGLQQIGTDTKSEPFMVPNITNPNSIFPIYFMNLETFSQKRTDKCNSNYNLTVSTGANFYFPLFQLRQYDQPIQFSFANFEGQFISELSSTYSIVRSTVKSIIISHPQNIFSLSFSQVSLTLPNKASADKLTYYGIVGQSKNFFKQLKTTYTTGITTQIDLDFDSLFSFTSCGTDFCSIGKDVSVYIIQNGWTCVQNGQKVTCT